MSKRAKELRYVICVRNEGYEVSLELRKLYQALPDPSVEGRHLLRIVDESGDDYLYPEDFFALIELPKAVEKLLAVAT
jgi:hypothetical protein